MFVHAKYTHRKFCIQLHEIHKYQPIGQQVQESWTHNCDVDLGRVSFLQVAWKSTHSQSSFAHVSDTSLQHLNHCLFKATYAKI